MFEHVSTHQHPSTSTPSLPSRWSMGDTLKDPRITLIAGQSRPETPDIESQQGRRNASAQLLDGEGAITSKVCCSLGLNILIIPLPVPVISSNAFSVISSRNSRHHPSLHLQPQTRLGQTITGKSFYNRWRDPSWIARAWIDLPWLLMDIRSLTMPKKSLLYSTRLRTAT